MQGWVKREMLGGPQKTQGCPKEQPVGEQPHHHPWMTWSVTYLAGNVWFTCGDPMQTFGGCYCISLACEELHHSEGKAQVYKHTWALCAGVLIQGLLVELCDSKRTKAASPKSCHGIHISSLWQPIPATGMAGAGWGPGCSALWLPLQRGRELSAAKGPEWATCEMAGYAGDKCVPLMGTCFSDLL